MGDIVQRGCDYAYNFNYGFAPVLTEAQIASLMTLFALAVILAGFPSFIGGFLRDGGCNPVLLVVRLMALPFVGLFKLFGFVLRLLTTTRVVPLVAAAAILFFVVIPALKPNATVYLAGVCKDSLVTVYRGTNIGDENAFFDETGYILSDAAREYYFEHKGAPVEEALAYAAQVHQKWIEIFGSEQAYVEAHGMRPDYVKDLGITYHIRRTLFSVTTNPITAEYFAQGGQVYVAEVPRNALIQQTVASSNEGEYLIRFGWLGFTPILQPHSTTARP